MTDYYKEMYAYTLPLLQELCNIRDENDKFLNIINIKINSSPLQYLIEIIDYIYEINNYLNILNI